MVNLRWMADILKGRKRVLLNEDVQRVTVPLSNYITVSKIIAQIQGDKRILVYLPDEPEAHVTR